jgi:tellurium resistance protein TerD
MSLQVCSIKPGDAGQKLSLNLTKSQPFKMVLSWDEGMDLDLHVLRCVNTGSGAKATTMEDVLSTYNVERHVRINGVMETVGTIKKNADGTFAVYGGAMVHSKDAEDGSAEDVDEWVKIYPEKLPRVTDGVVELPLLAMIHQQNKHFADVKNPKLVVFDMAGAPLLQINLSQEFGQYNGVHAGSIVITDQGAEFHSFGSGFNSDFNEMLGNFS